MCSYISVMDEALEILVQSFHFMGKETESQREKKDALNHIAASGSLLWKYFPEAGEDGISYFSKIFMSETCQHKIPVQINCGLSVNMNTLGIFS